MTTRKQFNTYKKFREQGMSQTRSARRALISQPTGSKLDKFETYEDFAYPVPYGYKDPMTSRENKRYIKSLSKLNNTVWRFAPRVPSWMKFLLGGK